VEGNWNRPPTNFGLKVALNTCYYTVKLKISVQVSCKPGTFCVHYYLASHHECRI